MKIRGISLAVIVLAVCSGASRAAVSQPARAIAQRIAQPPVIDGNLNDSAWSKASELSGFVLLNTHGKPAAQTRVKVATDGKSLFVGFWCKEPEMDKLAAKQTARDSAVWTDDSVEIIIDPANDRKGLSHLIISATGAGYDANGTVTAGTVAEDATWNGDWESAASKGKGEWYAEIKLPFAALGISPDESPCMGINFARARIAGAPEQSAWMPTTDNFINPSCLGELIIPAADNSYVTVDLQLPELLYVGKQTTRFAITNKSKQKIDLRFVYNVTGTANMAGNTQYATVHPALDAAGAFTLDLGGVGDFKLSARVEDKSGRILYSSGRYFKVPPPLGIEEGMYALCHKRADASIAVNVSPEQAKTAKLQVVLLSSQASGPVETKTIAPPLADPTRVSFDLSGKPAAMYSIKAELMQGDKALSSADSRTIPYKPDAPVAFDSHGFLTVDGKPYFPVGIYTLQDGKGKDHDSILREASEAGFNTTVYYASNLEGVTPLLDAAQRNGIKAFIYPTPPFSVAGVETTLANAAKDVAARKDHPALLGWYIVDEPEGIGKGAVDKTRELYQIVKEADPGHPCSLVVMSAGAAAKYGACADIMWVDPYPIPHAPVTFVSDCVSGAVKVMEPDKPVWAIPQAFDWSVWNTGKVNGAHRPTPDEERCMTYLALVHGAKGIIYWAHTASKYYIRDYPEHWAAVKKIAGELHDLSPVLLTPSTDIAVGLSPKDAPIDTMVRKLDGQTYIFAVSHDTKPCKVKLSLPDAKFSVPVEVLFEKRSVNAEKGVWQDEFKPLEVHVYRVEE